MKFLNKEIQGIHINFWFIH